MKGLHLGYIAKKKELYSGPAVCGQLWFLGAMKHVLKKKNDNNNGPLEKLMGHLLTNWPQLLDWLF